MISDKEIICPNNLLDVAHSKKAVNAGIVNAENLCQCCQLWMRLKKI